MPTVEELQRQLEAEQAAHKATKAELETFTKVDFNSEDSFRSLRVKHTDFFHSSNADAVKSIEGFSETMAKKLREAKIPGSLASKLLEGLVDEAILSHQEGETEQAERAKKAIAAHFENEDGFKKALEGIKPDDEAVAALMKAEGVEKIGDLSPALVKLLSAGDPAKPPTGNPPSPGNTDPNEVKYSDKAIKRTYKNEKGEDVTIVMDPGNEDPRQMAREFAKHNDVTHPGYEAAQAAWNEAQGTLAQAALQGDRV